MADDTSSQHANDDDAPLEPELFTTCECGAALDEPKEAQDAYCAECDPDAPILYWVGGLTPDGKKVDPDQAEGYRRLQDAVEDTYDLVFEYEFDEDTFVSLPDGTLVEAREWIERPENMALSGGPGRLAGHGEFDPEHPDRAWIGQPRPSGGMVRANARAYDDVATLAAEVCNDVFEHDKLQPGHRMVMVPGGEYVDAYDWAQRPETRRLAGCTTVRNRIRFHATATCYKCNGPVSTEQERVIQGEVGEQVAFRPSAYCTTCNIPVPAAEVSLDLVDDASGAELAPPRPLHAVDQADAQESLSGSLPADDVSGHGSVSGTLSGDLSPNAGTLAGSLEDCAPLPLPAVSRDLTGLPTAIDYANRLATYLFDLAANRSVAPDHHDLADALEATRADLVAHGVTGQALTDVLAVQEAINAAFLALGVAFDQIHAAGHAARQLAIELEYHLPVRHAYAATDNAAGADWFVQGE